jgi:2-dehydro-3-deoxygluconokinase
MSRVVTFGEIMLRLSPAGWQRLFQTGEMRACFGGAEANVAVSLANFGEDAVFVTRLPDQEIGHGAADALGRFGVDVSHTAWGGDRLGLYFCERGAGVRNSLCIYDRAGSAFQRAKPEDFDWDTIFRAADWFHFTGITPALGGELARICQEACRAARQKGITVSCDLNYRSRLWPEEEARRIMTALCADVDVCMGNEEDAETVFGIHSSGTDVQAGILSGRGYEKTMEELRDRFGFRQIAFSLRASHSATRNDLSGLLYDGERFCRSREYQLDHIVDRVGSGDSFAAGVIFGLCRGWDGQKTVEFATAASALKHSIEGDFNRVSCREVSKLADSGGNGRIER